MFLVGWDAGFTRGTEQDTGCQFLHQLINSLAKAKTASLRAYYAKSCVRSQVMNSDGSVRVCQTYPSSHDYGSIMTDCVRSLSPIAVICDGLRHQ